MTRFKPTKIHDVALQALVVVPAGTMPVGGWPTLVFGPRPRLVEGERGS